MAANTEIKKVITVDLGSATTSLKEYKKHIDELRGALLQLDETSEEYNEIAQEIKAEQDKLNEVMKVGKTTTDAAEGSYNQLAQTMSELKKQWKATADEAERDELGKQILDINNQLKELDASTGNFQRNVGDYANAFEKAFDKCLDGISSIDGPLGEIGGMAKQLVPTIKELNKTALAGLSGIKKGLAATGIGLAVVAVGELAAHWEDILKWAKQLFGAIKDDERAISDAATQAERMKDAFKAQNDALSYQSQLLSAQGKSNLEVLQAELKVREKQKNEARQLYLNDKTGNEELRNSANEAEAAWRKTLQAIQIEEAKIETQRRLAAEADEERRKKEEEEKQKAYATELEAIKAQREKYKDTIPTLSPLPTHEELVKSFDLHKKEVEAQAEELKKLYEEKQFDLSLVADEMTTQERLDTAFELESSYIQNRIALNEELLSDEQITAEERNRLLTETDALRLQMLQNEKKYNAESAKNTKLSEQQKKQYRQDAAMAAISTMGAMFSALADMEEEGSKQQRDLQIAAAVVNTLGGAIGAFLQGMATYPMPYGAIIGALGAATATAAGVAQISKMKSSGKGSGSASIAAPAVSAPSMTEVAPLLDEQADLNRMTSLNEQGDSASEQRNIRCYVVESDITDAQNKVSVTESNATY